MLTSQKTVLSFLIAVLFFTAFAVLAFTGLFELLEARFYNPSIVASITRDNTRNAEAVDRFLTEVQDHFWGTLQTQAVRRAFHIEQNAEEASNRAKIYTLLVESLKWVQWVRFIDSGGERIHFSTYEPDIESQDGSIPIYRDYGGEEIPYEEIAVREGEDPRYIFDGKSDRILFTFPLYDSFDIYWGTALFSLSANAVSDRLVSEGRIRFGQDLTVISNPPGLLFGTPGSGEAPLASQIAAAWSEEGTKPAKLSSPASGVSLALLSVRTPGGLFIGRLVNEEIFACPPAMKLILLASCFFTVFLIVFLLLNLRQDPFAVVQNRLKKLQVSLIEQFCELKNESDWSRWVRELEHRREEIAVQLKRGIDIDAAPDTVAKDIDTLIKKSWDELLSALGGGGGTGIDGEKLKDILKQILADITKESAAKNSQAHAASRKPGLLMKAAAIVKELEATETAEEIEELEEIEEPEEEIAEESPSPVTGLFREDFNYLASKIEFSAEPEPQDSPDDEILGEGLEIVSPFSAILDDFAKPSSGKANQAAGEDKPREGAGGKNVIVEREGVHYVNGEVLKPDPETAAALNRDFKNLVDSVIK